MAQWNVSDELDARLRTYLDEEGGDVTSFVEQAVADQLRYESDPEYRAQTLDKIRRGMAEIDAGNGVRDKDALRRIARNHGLSVE